MSRTGDMDMSIDMADSAGIPLPVDRKAFSQGRSGAKDGPPQVEMVATLSGNSSHMDGPPWPANLPKSGSVILPPSVEQRSPTYLAPDDRYLPEACIDARLMFWAAVNIAQSAAVPEETLFKAHGPGKEFALVPEPRSSVPFQWAHFGPGAIENTLADRPCSSFSVEGLLDSLNDVLGTNYRLHTPGLAQCLEELRSSTQDFGQLYSFVRGFWTSDFTQLTGMLADEKARDKFERQDAFQEGFIENPYVLPRRVWDLYSNRVLPMYAVPPKPGWWRLPDNVWPVSHSWVPESARVEVWTPINGYKWPVPIPCGTTLEHIRVELLNLGAEYVWLDVLCLRQRGRLEDEEKRIEEWKLDVPTIGYIYTFPNVPCVTYFNGLGLPFDPSPSSLASEHHWLNRVWTMQEATENWLPGGLIAIPSDDARTFFRDHHSEAIKVEQGQWGDRWASAAAMIQARSCSTELDRIHGLAYILGCNTLPIYDERVSLEVAWAVLLKHLYAVVRNVISLRHLEHQPLDTSILPSWEHFVQCRDIRDRHFCPGNTDLRLVDKSRLGLPEPGAYYHTVSSLGSLSTLAPLAQVNGTMSRQFGFRASASQLLHGIMSINARSLEATCIVIRLTDRLCLVAEVVGGQEVRRRPALKVVKRGHILLSNELSTFLPAERITIVYQSLEKQPGAGSNEDANLSASRPS